MVAVQFLASSAGRAMRVVAGIVLIIIGLAVLKGSAGWILAAVGLVPIAAGIFDVCLVAPAFGQPFKGADIRAKARAPEKEKQKEKTKA